MENNIQSLISIFKYRNKESNSKSFFAKDLEHYDFDMDAAEIVAIALENLDLFDVYFTTSGWFGDNDYIITEHTRDVNLIYKDLYPDNDITYKEFLRTTYPCDKDGMTDNYDNLLSDDKLLNGFFLDESKNNDQVGYIYYYDGPIYYFDNLKCPRWFGETTAPSKEKALNNLTSRAKAYINKTQNTKTWLDPKYLNLSDKNFIPVSNKNIKYCKQCGTGLNDGGTCPICDDGEEDY